MGNCKYIIFIILLGTINLYSQFKVVQSDPRNYSYDPVTKIHKLTDGTNRMQATAIWNDTSFPGFEKLDLREDFIIEAEMYFGFKDKEGADGIAFVLQSEGDDALGSLGVGMGFAANPYDNNKKVFPSLGVEIDTWYNSPASPPAVDRMKADHISYVVNGDLYDLLGNDEYAKYDYNNNKDMNVEDGKFHCVKYHWDADLQILSTYFDGQLRKSDNIKQELGRSLENLLASDKVFWGFTTGTATKDNVHMLIFRKVLRGKDAVITNIDTQSPTLIGDYCSKQVSPCDNHIDFKVNQTGLKIKDVEWQLVPPIYDNVTFYDNQTGIKDVIYQDKLYIVEVTYEDGSKAKDSVNAKYINFDVIMPDTVYICNNQETTITGGLKVNDKLIEDNNNIMWNWRPKGIFSKLEYNKAYVRSGIPDTVISCDIVYQVSDSVTKCVFSKEIKLINLKYNIIFGMNSHNCNNTLSVTLLDSNGERIDTSEYLSIIWKFNSKKIDKSKIYNGNSVNLDESGLLEVIITTKEGCEFTMSQYMYVDSSSPNENILTHIDTDYCENDTVDLSTIEDWDYYEWSTGSHNKNITVTTPGLYWVYVIDSSTKCEYYDTLNIQFHSKPEFSVQNEYLLPCDGDTLQINLETNDSNTVVWYDEDGNIISTSKALYISKATKVYAVITNEYGCSDTTEIINVRGGGGTPKYKIYSLNNTDQIEFQNTFVNKTYTKKLIIENLINDTYSINNFRLKDKLFFSIPSSQFPITLQPFQKDTIVVVFSSRYTGKFEDYIYAETNCDSQPVHLYTVVEDTEFEFTDRCGLKWQLNGGDVISYSAPYPNPTNQALSIDIRANNLNLDISNIHFSLFNSIGAVVNVLNTDVRRKNDIITITFNMAASNINSGVYFLNMEMFGETITTPIFFIK